MINKISVIAISWLFLSGCLGGDNMTSWKGRPVNDLVYAWGAPDKQDRLPDGRRVLSYRATSFDCEAMFRVDAAGIVQSAEAAGNIGGCNRLLLSKSAAK